MTPKAQVGSVHVLHIATGSDRVVAAGSFPAWAPDGAHIAFKSGGVTGASIEVIEPEAKKSREIAHACCGGAVFWSQDSTRIAASSSSDAVVGAPLVIRVGSREHQASSSSSEAQGLFLASWKPDGSALLASTGGATTKLGKHGTYDISLNDGATWLLSKLAPNAVYDAQRSPGGTAVAIASNDGAGGSKLPPAESRIYVLDGASGEPRSLTQGASDRSPKWSPDGRRLAFVRGSESFNGDLRIVDSDGLASKSLASGATRDTPQWLPDGSAIAFLRAGTRVPQQSDIWLVGADGSNLRQLTHDGD